MTKLTEPAKYLVLVSGNHQKLLAGPDYSHRAAKLEPLYNRATRIAKRVGATVEIQTLLFLDRQQPKGKWKL